MPKVRKIERSPTSGQNYFLVDACFLANKYIPENRTPDAHQRTRVQRCVEWWNEIDEAIAKRKARVYVPDICIAETFKTLAKKYFVDHWFQTAVELNNARNRLRRDIVTTTKSMRGANRHIRYHDISTSRDIIISVDRFFELFSKHKLSVSLPDLIIVATAKYLMDFFDIPKARLQIVTLDDALWRGCRKLTELPRAFNPTQGPDTAGKIFK